MMGVAYTILSTWVYVSLYVYRVYMCVYVCVRMCVYPVQLLISITKVGKLATGKVETVLGAAWQQHVTPGASMWGGWTS